MSRKDYDCSGVIPACLLPLNDDLSIDAASYRKHLRDIAGVRGVAAITVNGHASEVSSCTFEEQTHLLEMALDEIGDNVPVINGVYADGAADAVKIARMADAKGASALLVFPSNVFILGLRPEMVVDHYKRIADATDLPLIIFQFPVNTPLSYSHDILLRLIEEVPTVRAMKDGCGDPVRSEMTVRTLQSASRPFNVLSTHSAWLLQSLVTGCNGLLSGRRQHDCRPPGGAIRSRQGERSGKGKSHLRSHLPDNAGILWRSRRRHAQPHERSSGHSWAATKRSGSSAAAETAAIGNRTYP